MEDKKTHRLQIKTGGDKKKHFHFHIYLLKSIELEHIKHEYTGNHCSLVLVLNINTHSLSIM